MTEEAGDESGPGEIPEGTTVDRYDWNNPGSPSTAVIESVGEATGRDPDSLPPLYEAIESDALDQLLEGARDRDGGRTRVVFDWAGVTLVVESDGSIEVWQDVHA